MPLIPVPFDTTQITNPDNRSSPEPGDPCHPLAAGAHPPAIAFDCKATEIAHNREASATLRSMSHDGSHANGGGHVAVATETMVRRLTPIECERLQGFRDGYTAIPYRGRQAKDGPRYKALGNSWAVNVGRWIGRRIKLVDAIS